MRNHVIRLKTQEIHACSYQYTHVYKGHQFICNVTLKHTMRVKLELDVAVHVFQRFVTYT